MQLAMYLTGLVCGLFIGAALWEVFYAAPLYRKARAYNHRLSDRVGAWQRMALVEYATAQRIATSKAMFKATHRDETDTFSKKAPELRSVQ